MVTGCPFYPMFCLKASRSKTVDFVNSLGASITTLVCSFYEAWIGINVVIMLFNPLTIKFYSNFELFFYFINCLKCT